MKIIILNYKQSCVDVLPIGKDLEERSETIDWEMWLQDSMGYKLSEISWMLTEENDVPVFWGNEEIPFVTL